MFPIIIHYDSQRGRGGSVIVNDPDELQALLNNIGNLGWTVTRVIA